MLALSVTAAGGDSKEVSNRCATETSRFFLRYGGAVLMVAVAIGIRSLLDRWLGDYQPLATLYVPVLLSVLLGGFGPALVVVLLGYIVCDWLYMEPRGGIGFNNPQHVIGLVTYLISCGIIIGTTMSMQSARRKAEVVRHGLELEAARRREVEQRFRLAADAVNGIIYECNLATGHVERTRGLYEVVGYRPEEVAPTQAWWLEQIHPEDRERLLSVKPDVARATNAPSEYRVRHKDGRWLHVEDRAVMLRDESGQAVKIFGCTVDVSHRKRAEEELRQRVEELQALMEFMPIAVIRSDDALCQQMIGNPAAHKLLGVPIDKNLSKTPPPHVPPPAYLTFQNGVEVPSDCLPMQVACRDAVEVRDAEFRIIYASGESKDIYCYATPLFNASGQVRGCLFAAVDISERKKTEEALRRAEERFRASQDASLIGFTILNAIRGASGEVVDFEWEYVNPAAAAMLQRPASELVGQRLLQVLPNNHHNSHLFDRYVRVIQTGQPHDFELHYEGEGIDGWFRNMAVKLGDGVAVSFTDMTARRRAEEELRQRERLLQSVLDHTPAVIFIKDIEGRLLLVNQRFCELAGRPSEEIIGRLDREVFVGPTLADIQANDAKVFAERRTLDFEEVLDLADGPHTFLSIKVPVEDVGFSSRVLVGITTDITLRKRATEELAAQSRFLRRLIECSPVAIAILDGPDLRFRLVNAAFQSIVGPTAPLVGRTYREVFPEAAELGAEQALQNVLATGTPWQVRDFQTAVGDRQETWWDGDHIPLPDESGKAESILILTWEVTERKRAEQILRDADRRKDEFIATLAHELRNPLAPIRSAVKLLKIKGPADPELIWGRDVIDRQVGHMARLLDDLLDVSRITRNKLELRKSRVELREVIESAVETSRPLIDAGNHELQISLPSEPIYFEADALRLAQVFSNLLNNAAKYTDAGGHIQLSAHVVGDQVVVSVKDDGIGIEPEMIPELFQTFSQATPALHRSQGGLGIGLSLVKGLVTMHGGEITARSAGSGQGSEFILQLPLTAATAPKIASPEIAPKQCWDPCKVLIADDNRDAADSLSIVLRLIGHEVCTAYDGQEAVELAATFRPDLVLLDIGMPRLNGYQVCQHLRQQPWGQNCMIVALTGWGQEEDRRQSQAAGFDSHLVKPVELAAIEKLMTTHTASRA